jgi:L-amino acid N-acyltransferase YncA
MIQFGRMGARLEVCPMTLREARAWVSEHHRHHGAPPGGLFAIGASLEGSLVGVVIVGRPVARMLGADDFAAEVTRLCTDGSRNACSLLYGAAWRACRAMGYRRLITYTLATEPGTSLRAAGFSVVGQVRAESWSRPSRPRVDLAPHQAKLRWEVCDAG